MFVDYVKIYVQSGKGGDGLVSFRREKFVPKGGPDGGDGGKGGDVVFVANQHLSTLLDFRYTRHYKAKNGQPGGTARKTGKSGKDVVIQIPCGTIIKDAETNEILADVTQPRQRESVARGGIGGRGNFHFASSVNRTPRSAQSGKPGIERALILELKILADVGLIGFPSAGKSTLISTISAAKPKIAEYPFTTLVPNLGMARVGESQNFAVADIPGLIEGAHSGKGLGTQFLRHVERTKVLVFLLDTVVGDPRAQYDALVKELQLYNPDLASKRKIICLSKVDAIDEKSLAEYKTLQFGNSGAQVFELSSVTGQGVEKLKYAMWQNLQELRDESSEPYLS